MPASTTAGPAIELRVGAPGARPVRVTVAGVTSCADRGQAARIGALAEGLRRLGPAYLTVLTQTPGADAIQLAGSGAQFRLDPFGDEGAWPGERAGAVRIAPEAVTAETDLFLALVGDRCPTSASLAGARAAIAAGIPSAVFAAGLDSDSATEIAGVAAGADLVIAHDAASMRLLQRTPGLDAERLRAAGDPAVLLETAGPERRRRLLAEAGLEPGQRWVCLAPSAATAHRNTIDSVVHRRALLRFAEALWDQWRSTIILVPVSHELHRAEDDRRLTATLAAEVGGWRCHRLPSGWSAGDYRTLIAGAGLLVAGSAPAALAGYAVATATVAVGAGPASTSLAEAAYGTPTPPVTADLEELLAAPVRLADRWTPAACRDLAAALADRNGRIRRHAVSAIGALGPLMAKAAARRARKAAR